MANPCRPLRVFLYLSLFACSVVLLGLTADRIHYTKGLTNGDILTTDSHFYDPIIVELLVTSCLAILFSCWLVTAILARIRGPMGSYIIEHCLLWIVWIMFLVGAAITTNKWLHLKWCRGSSKTCRILETIKAFSWICWILTTFMIIASLVHMGMDKSDIGGPIYGGERERSHPEVRQTQNTGATTYVAHNNRTTTENAATEVA